MGIFSALMTGGKRSPANSKASRQCSQAKTDRPFDRRALPAGSNETRTTDRKGVAHLGHRFRLHAGSFNGETIRLVDGGMVKSPFGRRMRQNPNMSLRT